MQIDPIVYSFYATEAQEGNLFNVRYDVTQSGQIKAFSVDFNFFCDCDLTAEVVHQHVMGGGGDYWLYEIKIFNEKKELIHQAKTPLY